eukprot:5448833-Amphidinium_carterae.1
MADGMTGLHGTPRTSFHGAWRHRLHLYEMCTLTADLFMVAKHIGSTEYKGRTTYCSTRLLNINGVNP